MAKVPFFNDIHILAGSQLQIGDSSTFSITGDNLIINNSAGDIVLGDGTSDVFIGDGTSSVDVLFEQSGSIKAEDGSSGVVLTVGSSDTDLVLVAPQISGALYDNSNSSGTSGQILSSTGTGTDWVDQGNVVAGEADKALSLTLRVKNTESVALTKGQVVCAAPSATPPSGNVIEVKLADNNGTNSMPAIGILNEGLDAAGGANDEGEAIMFGRISGIDTSAFSVGDEVFVSDTAGALTATKPTGVKYIQKVGVIMRDDASNGTIEVFGAGRTNDVPTPLYIDHANQRVGIGVESPSHTLDVDGGAQFNTNTGATPFYITRLGSTNESLKIYTGDTGSVFETIQDETTGTYGSMAFKLDAGAPSPVFSFEYGSTVRAVIEGGTGNVGIGTTSPAAPLTIANANGGNWNDGLIIDDPSGWAATIYKRSNVPKMFTGLYSGNDDYIWMSSGYSNSGTTITAPRTDAVLMARPATNDLQIYLETHFGGNVGIGTDNPSTNLHLNSTGATQLRVSTSSTSSEPQIIIIDGDGDYFAIQKADRGITFKPQGAEAMRITSTGNVGIGTTSPGALLDVDGSIRFNKQLATNNTNGAAKAFIHANSSSGSAKFKVYKNVDTTDGYAYFRIDRSYDYGSNDQMVQEVVYQRRETTKNVKFKYEGDTTTSDDVYLEFYELADGTVEAWVCHDDFAQSAVSITYFESTGDTYPEPTSGTPTGTLIHSTNPDTETPNWDTYQGSGYFSGNVGIGTSSPGEILHIESSSPKIQLTDTSTNASSYIDADSGFGSISIMADHGNTSASSQINLMVDGSSKMVVKDTGNVGIGTTSPGYALSVNGDVQSDFFRSYQYPTSSFLDFDDDTTPGSNGTALVSVSSMKFIADSNNNATTDAFSWIVDGLPGAGSTLMTLTDEGNLGIGTTNPNSNVEIKEDVNNGEGAELRVINDGTAVGTGQTTTITIGRNFEERNIKIKSVSSEDYGRKPELVITQNQNESGSSHAEVLRIDSSGNVGIGEDEPATKLDVSGNIRMTETAATSDTDKFVVLDSGVLKYRNGTDVLSDIDAIGGSGTGGTIALFTSSGTDLGNSIITQTSQPNKITIGGELAMQGSGDVLSIYHYAGTTWFIDTSTGDDILFGAPATNTQNVGVQGDLYAYNGDLGTKSFGSFNNKISISGDSYFNAGNVGIGTTSPAHKLTINASNNTTALGIDFPSAHFDFSANSTSGYTSNFRINDVGMDIGHDSTARSLNLQTGNQDRLTILGTGNVGIGTTSPGATLEVRKGSEGNYLIVGGDDASNARALIFSSSTAISNGALHTINAQSGNGQIAFKTGGTEALRIDSSQNVGIGTTSPGAKLDVVVTPSAPWMNLINGNETAFRLTTYNNGTNNGSSTYAFKQGLYYNTTENAAITFYRGGGTTGGFLTFTTNDGAERMRINSGGYVGIGTTSPTYKLSVSGGVNAGGKITYTKSAASLDTTGYAVAGLTTSSNGLSAGFIFTCFGHTGNYQKIVYSCYNASGTWYTKKVIDEGTNAFDVEASANAATITFTFKSTSGTKSYTPRVTVEATGSAINSIYA